MSSLKPIYITQDVNSEIILYEGDIRICSSNEQSEEQKGIIALEWLPKPCIVLRIEGTNNDYMSGNAYVELLGFIDKCGFIATESTHSSHKPSTLKASINAIADIGKTTDISCVVFHLPNFRRLFSRRDRMPSDLRDEKCRPDDIFLEADGWKVRVHSSPNADDLERKLKKTYWNGITHAGAFANADDSAMDIELITDRLHALYHFFSFVAGYWVNPILPVGFDSNGNRIWERWGPWRFDSYRARTSWCDRHHGHTLSEVFAGFMRRWANPDWRDPIHVAIHLYVASNRGDSDLESKIILIQSALELLASALFVDDLKSVPEKKWDDTRKFQAWKKIRMLLDECQIPAEIPDKLDTLHQLSSNFEWKDGPHAFTSVRNWIGHPTKSNRNAHKEFGAFGTYQAFQLGAWYLELVLLKLFNYNDVYFNRTLAKHVGEVDLVPWSIHQ